MLQTALCNDLQSLSRSLLANNFMYGSTGETHLSSWWLHCLVTVLPSDRFLLEHITNVLTYLLTQRRWLTYDVAVRKYIGVSVVGQTDAALRLFDWQLVTDSDDIALLCLNNSHDHCVCRLFLNTFLILTVICGTWSNAEFHNVDPLSRVCAKWKTDWETHGIIDRNSLHLMHSMWHNNNNNNNYTMSEKWTPVIFWHSFTKTSRLWIIFSREDCEGIALLVYISITHRDVFTKFGVYIEVGVLHLVEWSKYTFLKNPKLILLKFCMMTHTKVPEGWRGSKLKPEVEFCRQGALYRISFWGKFDV